jgi:hypothetical protein
VIRILLLGWCLASIYIREDWAYIAALACLVPVVLY